MATLRPVVQTLWQHLGLAAPLEEIGSEFSFEIGETPVTLRLEANGETVTFRGNLGYLERNPHQAGDQLKRLLRIGLGLTAINRAVLDARAAEQVLAEEATDPVPVFAICKTALSDRQSFVAALQDVVDWQDYASSVLSRTPGTEEATPQTGTTQVPLPDEEMIIFQP